MLRLSPGGAILGMRALLSGGRGVLYMGVVPVRADRVCGCAGIASCLHAADLLELVATAAIPEGMAAAPPNIAILSRRHMHACSGPEADQAAEATQSPSSPEPLSMVRGAETCPLPAPQ